MSEELHGSVLVRLSLLPIGKPGYAIDNPAHGLNGLDYTDKFLVRTIIGQHQHKLNDRLIRFRL